VIGTNYGPPGLTIQCLRSIEPEIATMPGCVVIVVDNASGDDSVEQLSTEIEAKDWVRLVCSDSNLGFAGGNNLGIREAGDAKYVLLLNSDTIVHPGCFKACVEAMEADAGIGALSCNVLNEDGSVQNVARRFPTPARQIATVLGLPWRLPRFFAWADMEDPGWDRWTEARDVDWLGGAFMMSRGDVLREIGGLDESFFFYGEDIAVCHAIHKAGYRCRYDPRATIVHLGGASSDPSRMAETARNAHAWRGRYLVQRRCYGVWAAWLVRAVDVMAMAARALWRKLKRETGRDDAWKTFVMLLRPLPKR
jgi:GT2 family glycosyltransferase